MMFKISYFVVLATISFVQTAPRGKTATTYDQKQTGEYNIQLHLKDFQIIAVVGEDSLGSLSGDYDYNYDYSDFTVKPITPSTTTKKPDLDTTEKPITTTKKINVDNPYPIVSPPSTLKPINASTPTINISVVTTTVETEKESPTTAKIQTETQTTPKSVPDVLALSNLGQIPVFIHDAADNDTPFVNMLKDSIPDKKVEAVTNVAIVPIEDIGNSAFEQDQPTLGEILHYRRCAQGYSRDKRGRCRKVRRPQIPMGITRFASNLASRFRQVTTNDNLEAPESLQI